ncbi:hypothetical protein LCGC14_1252060 [marine sediment metagenome]|uniref:Uncharacterized protein n=1 Tax=marine sediment metagenome TaxID=412755 RepID=A0A0F9NJT8_9ZZZZ
MPTVYLDQEAMPPTNLVLSQAWYASRGDGYELIGVVPSRPSVLHVITLGAMKDADSPAYYVHGIFPVGVGQGQMTVLIAPWEGGQAMKGQATKGVNHASGNRVHVDYGSVIQTTHGRPVSTGELRVKGYFRQSEARFSKLLSEYQRELSRLSGRQDVAD